MIYLLTAIGLSPGGSITEHIYTQTVQRTTQITTNLEECGPCPVFANFTLTFALQLRKNQRISVKFGIADLSWFFGVPLIDKNMKNIFPLWNVIPYSLTDVNW